MIRKSPTFARLALTLALAITAGCQSIGPVQDPVVVIEGEGGTELGVTTDYGILFLGRNVRAGKIAVTAWFGDGPSLEISVVEPVAPGLFTAETEIQLPSIPLTFVNPSAGEKVLVSGRRGRERWFTEAFVTEDPRVRAGILLDLSAAGQITPDQIGAPVYVQNELGKWRCLGIVSGRLKLDGEAGEAEYLTVLGPESTWRLVSHRRSVERRRRWIYREDIL